MIRSRRQGRWGVSRPVTLALCSLAALAAPAAADVVPVNTTADDGSGCDLTQPPPTPCTLRGALSWAGDHPPSTVTVPAGRYVLAAGVLHLPHGVTVTGAGARTTIIDGNRLSRVLTFVPTVPADPSTLGHLTLTGGRAGADTGGDIQSSGVLTLDHVRVTDGDAGLGGGGVANVGGALTVDHSLFDLDAASGAGAKGGAILSTGASGAPATLTVTNSTITQNGANGDGGGISVGGDAADATTLTHVTLANNGSTSAGGSGLNADAAPGTIHIGSSILAGNLRNSMPSNCVGVTAIDDGANVESGTDCGLAAGSDRQNADAALAALSDHGGETDVRPLGDTSAAIDLVPAGGCPATDQVDRSRPKGPACDAGAFEADALPPPPPPPPSGPHAHTLVGDVDYEPAFGPGKEEAFYHLSPFVIHPAPRLQVVLLAADGATVMEQSLDPRSAEPDNGFGTYRFDALPACGSCTLLLRDGSGVVQDARAVSFDAAEGQTEQNLILSDRPGAAAFGAVMTPDRQARPGTLSVRLSRGGQVLADTGALPAQCPLINGGDWCGGSERFAYRLTGLPADNQPMTATLYERPVKYDPLGAHPQGPPVPVDSALVTAKVGPDRVLKIPDLTAPEGFPPTVRGRGLYGTVWNRPPYAPGDQGPGQSLPKGRHPQVVLFDGSRRIASAQIVNPDRNEPGRYSLYGLPPCANCKLKLIDGPMVADHARVTIPASPSISLIRRDLQLRDASGHFIGGAVRAPDSIRPDRLRIVVRRPGDPAVIADSEQLPHACRPGTDASHCHRGQPTYRLGGIPANTPVLVTLSLKTGGTWNPVDSRFLVTAARDQDTNVPGLELLPGVGAHDPGVQVYGYIVPGGPFAPGADAAPIAARASYSVSVLDAGGHLLGHTTATSGAHAMSDLRYQIIGLKSCDQCTVELRGHGGVLEDRAPLSLPAESPSVTRAPNLDTGHAAGGPYLTGSLSARTAFSHSDVVVRVLDANGEVRVSSTDANVSQRCGIPPGPCARSRDASFRLGHMPLDGQVTVGVMDTHTRRVLASARVTLAGNGADTFMPALRLANR